MRVRLFEALDGLPLAYADLFEQASERSVFLSLPWFRNMASTVAAQADRVSVLGLVEDEAIHDRPLAALVLWRRQRRYGLLEPTTVEGLSNYYTAYFGPVLARGEKDVSGLAEGFARAFRARAMSWDVLDLRPLDPETPFVVALIAALRSVGVVVQTYFCFGNWYLNVAGRSYAEYLRGLPSVLRKNIPYMARKLERTVRSRMVFVTSEDGLATALDDYERVYRASWRDTPEPYPEFIRGLATTAAEQGWLRLGILYVEEEPAAAQLWITHAGVASIYKICYDERFGKLSVGTILTARMMEHALDVDKVKEVDYLSGDDDYKSQWMSDRRERWGLMAFNPRSVHGILRVVRHVGGRFMRDRLRRLRGGPTDT